MSLIINTPFECPAQHWVEGKGGKLEIKPERRPASYEVFDARNNTKRTEVLDLVNTIRARVDQWREDGWPGVTIVTRKLLEHWHDRDARQYPFYFCQLEAIETLIWWVEGAEAYKQGIAIPGDGGTWERLCNKMATGAGKTTVMAMIITWQVLNALTYPKRNKDFSRAVFIVAPGLTVKERLQVLLPSEGSYYDEFNLCPSEALRQKLNQAEVLIENWHTLMPLKEADRSVVKKGRESDEAFTRRVLGKLAAHKDIIVINDEAHHAYRKPPEVKISKKAAAEQGIDLDEATRWIEGLDRIHKTRRIQRCFDLSATPFAPTGKKSTDTALFDWIVSDFGLNDAIEAGLVKTPRVVVRDDAVPDAKTLRSKLYHIYRDPSVSEDLNRAKAEPHEALPKLVQDAYTLLGADWRETRRQWQEAGHHSPPVMLTVCNRTETAARIENYFNKGDAHWPELHAPDRTLRVDSKVLEKAEIGETASSDKDYEARLKEIIDAADLPETRRQQFLALKKEELLREIVDNVGKRGAAGQDLQNVISVAMLSEGWDAKNVTHIMGLRAFTSQLLCEQVVGRGLRRVSYDTDENGLFLPEYVNVFGVPLSISETGEGGEAPPPPKPTTQIEVVPDRAHLELRWPNVLRVETVVKPELAIDWSKVPAARARSCQHTDQRRTCPGARRRDGHGQGHRDRPREATGWLPSSAPRIPGCPEGVCRAEPRVHRHPRVSGGAAGQDRRGVPELGPPRHPVAVSLRPASAADPHRAQHRPRGPACAEQRDRAEHGTPDAGVRRGKPDRCNRADAHLVHDQAVLPDDQVAHQPSGGRFCLGGPRGQRLREAR